MILVTGGTGLLGNCIVRELIDQNASVRVLCRAETSREALDGLDVELITADLTDPDSLREAVQGCTAVIHSAAMIHIGWQKLAASRRANVDGTLALAQACIENQAKFVYVSTVDTLPAAKSLQRPISESGTDADGSKGVPKTPCSYVISKSEAEQAIRQLVMEEDLDARIVHPGFMLGPWDWKPSSGRMMLEVYKAPIVAAPPGGCSCCDARDVAWATVRTLERGHQGQSFILAGENIPYHRLWSQMLQTAGRKKTVLRLGQAIRMAGMPIDWLNHLRPNREGDVNGAAIAMGCLNHYYDSGLAQETLGYSPRPLEETLTEAWQWLAHRFLSNSR